MAAQLNVNPDNSYSLHMTKAEMEAVTLLVQLTRLGNTSPYPKAVFNILEAIEDTLGLDWLDDVLDTVPHSLSFDDPDDESTWCIDLSDQS